MKGIFERINANPKMRNCAIILVLSLLILRFPELIAWLPKDLFDKAWALATNGFDLAIAYAVLFSKQNNVSNAPHPIDTAKKVE